MMLKKIRIPEQVKYRSRYRPNNGNTDFDNVEAAEENERLGEIYYNFKWHDVDSELRRCVTWCYTEGLIDGYNGVKMRQFKSKDEIEAYKRFSDVKIYGEDIKPGDVCILIEYYKHDCSYEFGRFRSNRHTENVLYSVDTFISVVEDKVKTMNDFVKNIKARAEDMKN